MFNFLKHRKVNTVVGLLAVAFLTQAGGCHQDSDAVQSQRQETMVSQAVDAIGMPAITNFQEMRVLKQILESRDQAKPTISYLVDLNGHLHKFCDSLGYPIPAATQFTSPSKVDSAGRVMPQADPNGLFSPSSSHATYVVCLDPQTHKAEAIYSEPDVFTSPFPVQTQ